MTSTLYNQDYYLWLEKTVQLLEGRQFDQLDIPNLIEEIEDMAKGQKHALGSNLTVVLMHLLKYKYQPDVRSNSWITIREHRNRLKRAFRDSPSLRPYFLLWSWMNAIKMLEVWQSMKPDYQGKFFRRNCRLLVMKY